MEEEVEEERGGGNDGWVGEEREGYSPGRASNVWKRKEGIF